MSPKVQKVFSGIMAVIWIAICVFVLLFALMDGTLAENHYNSCMIQSQTLRISSAPDNAKAFAIIRVDIMTIHIPQDGEIESEISFDVFPKTVGDIFLWDGYHAASGVIKSIEDNKVKVNFFADELAQFDSTVGVYLVVMESW